MLKIGLLGASRIAPKALIPQVAHRDDCEITAIACRDDARGKDYCDTHSIATHVKSYEALCEREDVDIVYNALPPQRHRDLTIHALKAGKHVLCEKPFALNAGEAKEMADAADETGRVLMEAFHYRFHPAFERLLTLIAESRIGKVTHIDGIFTVHIEDKPGELRHDPALGGGALMDLGCYPLHAARMIIGEEPTITQARARDNGRGADLELEADLSFPSGATTKVLTSMAPETDFTARISVIGQNGEISLTNFIHPHKGHDLYIKTGADSLSETVDGQTTYDHQLDHFVRLVRGETAPILPPADAVANMTAIDAIYRAAGYDR